MTHTNLTHTNVTRIEVDRTNWTTYAAPQVDRTRWSAVIAAAGKGSRLGSDRPKILFPVAGRTILEWLLDLLLPYCETAVFVLSPDGRKHVEPELERLAPARHRIAIQETPSGMGDAVEIGAALVSTPHTAVIWGDQVAVRPASLESVLRLHEGTLAPDLTIPSVFRPNPYSHLERDEQRNIVRVLQAREGDAMPAGGESDAGLFCFRTTLLQRLLTELRDKPESRGAQTAEFNFLPAIPLAVSQGCRVLTPHLMDLEETVGVNSAADALQVEPFLRKIVVLNVPEP
jgi:bifunctional N-acetylglucosamine-1-phosphate-uridyltransferase/glucosamine-1-phosphate-acetyltransferase GlmU-like protein